MRNIRTTVRGHYDDDRYIWAIIIRRFCDRLCVRSPPSGASGRLGQSPNREPTTLLFEGLYKYLLAGSKGFILSLWHTWHPCESKQISPTHLHHWFTIIVRLRVIPSAFAWVIASSGTWGSLSMRISCYSWWLPPPRRLRAAVEVWHVLVIVYGRF
jgi:hypothetical protein